VLDEGADIPWLKVFAATSDQHKCLLAGSGKFAARRKQPEPDDYEQMTGRESRPILTGLDRALPPGLPAGPRLVALRLFPLRYREATAVVVFDPANPGRELGPLCLAQASALATAIAVRPNF